MEGGDDFAKLPDKIACVFSGAALGKSFLAGFLFRSRIDFCAKCNSIFRHVGG
jgi:hypothetical protein